MTAPKKKPRSGPFEQWPSPRYLRAAAVEPGPQPRLHGYEFQTDLAQHYSLGEVMLLGLTGAVPEAAAGRAFERALTFAASCPVNEAPTHAAMLARSVGAPVQSALSSGFVVVCEAAAAMVSAHAAVLAWLACEDASAEIPPSARATTDDDAAATARLNALMHDPSLHAFVVPDTLTPNAAVLTVLWRCGLRSEGSLIAALAWAKTISIAAEAIVPPTGSLLDYAATTPDFNYEGPSDDQ